MTRLFGLESLLFVVFCDTYHLTQGFRCEHTIGAFPLVRFDVRLAGQLTLVSMFPYLSLNDRRRAFQSAFKREVTAPCALDTTSNLVFVLALTFFRAPGLHHLVGKDWKLFFGFIHPHGELAVSDFHHFNRCDRVLMNVDGLEERLECRFHFFGICCVNTHAATIERNITARRIRRKTTKERTMQPDSSHVGNSHCYGIRLSGPPEPFSE